MNKNLSRDEDIPIILEDQGEKIPLRTEADIFTAAFEHTEAMNRLMRDLHNQAEKNQQ